MTLLHSSNQSGVTLMFSFPSRHAARAVLNLAAISLAAGRRRVPFENARARDHCTRYVSNSHSTIRTRTVVGMARRLCDTKRERRKNRELREAAHAVLIQPIVSCSVGAYVGHTHARKIFGDLQRADKPTGQRVTEYKRVSSAQACSHPKYNHHLAAVTGGCVASHLCHTHKLPLRRRRSAHRTVRVVRLAVQRA